MIKFLRRRVHGRLQWAKVVVPDPAPSPPPEPVGEWTPPTEFEQRYEAAGESSDGPLTATDFKDILGDVERHNRTLVGADWDSIRAAYRAEHGSGHLDMDRLANEMGWQPDSVDYEETMDRPKYGRWRSATSRGIIKLESDLGLPVAGMRKRARDKVTVDEYDQNWHFAYKDDPEELK